MVDIFNIIRLCPHIGRQFFKNQLNHMFVYNIYVVSFQKEKIAAFIVKHSYHY